MYACSPPTSSPISASSTPDIIYSLCSSAGVTDNDYSICGSSKIDLASYNKTMDVKPSNVTTPKDTICQYEMTYKSKVTDTFTITMDTSASLVMKQTSNGITTTVTPKRMLNAERGLATSTSTYSVTNAETISVYYLATSDISTSSFIIVTGNNYYDLATGSSSSSGSSGSTDKGTASVSSSSDTGIIVMIVVTICIIAFVLIFGAIVVILWWRRRRKGRNNQARIRDARNVHVQGNVQIQAMPIQVKQKIDRLQEMEFSKRVNAFNIDNCVICLDNFRDMDKIRLMPTCGHIFHSKCIIEYLTVSFRNGSLKWPLCNQAL